jgi:hypothetical protein
MFPTYRSARGRALEILQGGAEYGRAVAAQAAEEEARAAPADERYSTVGEGCCTQTEVQARSFIVMVILILKAWRRRRSGARIRVCAEKALRDSEAERRTHQKEAGRRRKKKEKEMEN